MNRYIPRRLIIERLKKNQTSKENRKEFVDFIRRKMPNVKILSNLYIKLSKLINITFHKLDKTQSVLPIIKIIVLKIKSVILVRIRLVKIKIPNLSVFYHKLSIQINSYLEKYYKVGILLLVFIFLWQNIKIIWNNYNRLNHLPEIRQLNLYPTLPNSWTNMARVYFESNQENLAWEAFQKSKIYYPYYLPTGGSIYFKSDIQDTELLLKLPQKRRQQLSAVTKLIEKYPYSWQLWSLKALYEKELYLVEDSKNSLNQSNWLYPKNEIAQKIDNGFK